MPVMAYVTDMDADVMQQSAVFQQVPFAVATSVHAARLIEDRERQPGHLLRVLGPVSAALAELDDAAAADVGVALDLADAGAVAVDVVEDEPLTQGEIAERELLGPQPADDRVEQDRARNAQVRAPRVEPGDGEPLLDVVLGEALPQLVQ